MVAAPPEPMFGRMLTSTRVNVVGIPAGAFIYGAGILLSVAGLAAVWRWKWPWAGIAVFTIPATLLVVFGPAVILILENLGGT
jgi:hypothetical protein